jgi:hypothetical protein
MVSLGVLSFEKSRFLQPREASERGRWAAEGAHVQLPIGLDYAWLACDAVDFVARFTNAGQGPVPVAVLAKRELADQAEMLMRNLPFVGGHEMQVELPDPTDFIRIAHRGLYAFDWQDAHRTTNHSGCYEIVSRPLRPLRAEELPPELRRLAELVRFDALRFADNDTICIGKFVKTVV